MKSLPKKMPAKKQKPLQQDSTETMSISLPDTGAADTTYTISGATDDLITVDPNSLITGSITSASTLSWTSTNDYTINNYNYNYDPKVVIDQKGIDIKTGGDIMIGGRSLSEAISGIEDRLAILKPNPELEERWEQLKELRRQYESLEKDILEKEKIMKILKET